MVSCTIVACNFCMQHAAIIEGILTCWNACNQRVACNNLACSDKLPTWLYILPSVSFFFFKLSKAVPGSTGPIFTIFHQMEGICVNVVHPDQFFRFPKGRCHGNFGQNW